MDGKDPGRIAGGVFHDGGRVDRGNEDRERKRSWQDRWRMGAVLVAGWMAGIRIAETRTAQSRIIGGEGSRKDRGRIA